MARTLLSCVLIAFMPVVTVADTVTIPFGTTVFCELEQRITTKQKASEGVEEGDVVRAHVWKDVYADGHLVIAAGTPVYTRVSDMKKARMAGRKGELELEVLNVQGVDGRDVPLEGGYDKSGKGRMGLSIALAAVVAWPLIFLKGKQAWLEPGTIFDAMVRSPTEVRVEDQQSARKIKMSPSLVVAVDYDAMDPDGKIKDLPLIIEVSEGALSKATIVSVNDAQIPPIQVTIVGQGSGGLYDGVVDFKVLSKHFTRGMNRFAVQVGGDTAEVLLEIEL